MSASWRQRRMRLGSTIPLKVFIVFVARILKYVRIVIGEGMPAGSSFGATVSAR